MKRNEILESGILELYVLGLTSMEENEIVEKAKIDYPEVIKEISEIENALEAYAKSQAIAPSEGLKDKILTEARKSVRPTNQSNDAARPNWGLTSALLVSLAALAGLWFYLNTQITNLNAELDKLKIECDSGNLAKNIEFAMYQSLLSEDTKSVAIAATPKYPNSRIVLYNNDLTKELFLRAENLPELGPNESFQLWSIKGTDAPIPLDVFGREQIKVLKLNYVDNTNVYAITIEDLDGSLVPNLDQLIGTFSITG